jgi:hypothetical protein
MSVCLHWILQGLVDYAKGVCILLGGQGWHLDPLRIGDSQQAERCHTVRDGTSVLFVAVDLGKKVPRTL